ncbi:MAG TPA: SRPBCC family protein [Solirubrobacteraceae bacterium]|nr:SRPBCC family protein [Solirubrobacteraceae bacterium]
MPTARASRTIAAPVHELWELVRDPHHLPRWWPRVARVEDVKGGAFTEVMKTKKGKLVRADFNLVDADRATHTLRWRQRLDGTPFARVLAASETEVRLTPAAGAAATVVTLELRQTATGLFSRLGGYLLRRAARATLHDALDALERISG